MERRASPRTRRIQGGSVVGINLMIFGILMVILSIMMNKLSNRAFAQIALWQQRPVDGVSPAEIPLQVQRQVISYIPKNAILNFLVWLLAGLFWSCTTWIGTGFAYAIRVLIGTIGVGGILTTTVVYFSTDWLWRSMIPIFIPDGKPRAVGGLRLSIQSRLLIVFLLNGLWHSLC